MRFIDFFSGIGGFRVGMERAGHKCVGFCEWDKYAAASYTSMHLITEEQRAYLATLPLKKRQKEILKDEYRNGEWYADDIRNVRGADLPLAEVWCFGAPCQDFSIAGCREGLDGDRSSLVREVFRLVREVREEDRPEWLIYENVKGMFSSNRGLDYLAILLELDELGYDAEWQLFNSKDHGVPQNRERIYTVGHIRTKGRSKIFPIQGTDRENSVQIRQCGSLSTDKRKNKNQYRVYEQGGLAPTLNKMDGGGLEPHTVVPIRVSNPLKVPIREAVKSGYSEATEGEDSINLTAIASKTRRGSIGKGCAQTLDTLCAQGILVKVDDDLTEKEPHTGLPVNVQMKAGTPIVKVMESEQPVGALEARDYKGFCQQGMNGVAQKIEVLGKLDENRHSNQNVYGQCGVMSCIEDSVYAVWNEKYNCYIAIRKLTPRECFRLQGFPDELFERAEFVNSDSQLYKQAGNAVTTNVVEVIARRLKEEEQ